MNESVQRNFRFQPSKALQHFPEDEYIQICQLVSNKIDEYKETFSATELGTDIAQKLKEITDVIMNCIEYPEGLFRVQELLTGCQILLQSNDISMITSTIHFLSMAIYSSTNLSEYFSDLFPLIFKISFPNSDIFIKVYFSLLTNIFTDLKSNNNIALIDNLLINYYQNLMEYITSLEKFYKEELTFLMILSVHIKQEKDSEAYLQFTSYLLNLLKDQRISSNENFQSIVLWSIYENCKHNIESFYDLAISSDFFRFLIDNISNYESFPICCLEPIFIILYLSIEYHKSASFISENDLPFFLFYCKSSNTYVQYDSLRLTRNLIQFFTLEFLALNVLELIDIFNDVEFKSSKEILLIACSLIFYLPSLNLMQNISTIVFLINFVMQNINFDKDISVAALQSLIKIKEEFEKLNKLHDFSQIFEESNQNGQFDELRDSQIDEILDLIEILDSK